jgi:hypothetical protein
LASSANGIDDAEQFSSDMADGHAMMFVQVLPMAVIDLSKTGLMEASHTGGLIESGAQGNAAAFAHFDFAAPLATFAHAGVHAGIGQEGMEGTATCKAVQIAELGGDQRPGDRAAPGDSLDGVFHARKEFLDVGIEFGQLLLEKLQLRDHGADEQIKGRILAAGSQASLGRLLERFGFRCTEPTAAGTDKQPPRVGAQKAGR